MKRKLLLVLCACMLLGGCGREGKMDGYGQAVDAGTAGTNADDKSVEEVDANADGKAGEASGAAESEAVDQETGDGKNNDAKQNDSENVLSDTTHKLGESGENTIAPVTLTDEYEKAAFFADQVYAGKKENTIVSPLSLDIALGLAYEGASGKTAEELKNYLGTEDYGSWADDYMTYAEGLKCEKSGDGDYSFAYELANSIWVKKGSTLKKEYRALVEEKYRAIAENVDFVKNAEQTAQKINSWCDEKTHGMIKEMVTPDMFSEDLEAILMNSVYFESPWMDKWGLIEHEFTDIDGKKENREMLSDGLSVYFENDHATGFAKPYYNGFEFIGILPKEEGDFNLSDLDLKSFMDSRTSEYDVTAIAPKLDYETYTDKIVDILKAQGVHQAFNDGDGQFDRLVEDAELYISDILQKCKIEMDDQGTRAAAVTAIMMLRCTAVFEPDVKEKKEVFLDRPFAFLIYDKTNEKIVFAGKVVK